MNNHCLSCLRVHSRKFIVCILAAADIGLAILQTNLILSTHTDDPKLPMLAIVIGRAALTWIMLGLAVVTLNQMLKCHTTNNTWTTRTLPGGR